MEKNYVSSCCPDVKIITPADGAHYFFGYYDLRATQGERHLAHRVQFMDRLPEAGDVAELGYLEDGAFTPFAATTAWNFQQGALMQYHPYLNDTVYYNGIKSGRFTTVTHNYATGEKKFTDRPAACISPDGKWGLSVNFGRIYAFRPGYGYVACPDPYENENAPAEDGIFLTDMETGVSRQIADYKYLAEVGGFRPDQKILVNHITFSPTSDRYVALLRNFRDNVKLTPWSTSLIIGDLSGNVRTVLPTTYVSHYIWANDHELIAHCSTVPGVKSMFRINMNEATWAEYDMPYFHDNPTPDIHCNLSPDGKYVIGDGYPINGYREIQVYNIETGNTGMLLKAKTVIPAIEDIRCDLHNRFVFGGEYISFDTTLNGCRQIALVPTDALKNF